MKMVAPLLKVKCARNETKVTLLPDEFMISILNLVKSAVDAEIPLDVPSIAFSIWVFQNEWALD